MSKPRWNVRLRNGCPVLRRQCPSIEGRCWILSSIGYPACLSSIRARRKRSSAMTVAGCRPDGAGYVCSRLSHYLFFHPPRCPGAPPLERGAGANSGPDWRESAGWKILLPPGSRVGLLGLAPLGRHGRDSAPRISSRWGLWVLELEDGPPVGRPAP